MIFIFYFSYIFISHLLLCLVFFMNGDGDGRKVLLSSFNRLTGTLSSHLGSMLNVQASLELTSSMLVVLLLLLFLLEEMLRITLF